MRIKRMFTGAIIFVHFDRANARERDEAKQNRVSTASIWRAKRPKNAMRFEVLPGRSGIELALRAHGSDYIVNRTQE